MIKHKIKMKNNIVIFILGVILINVTNTSSSCVPRDFGNGGTVCVCTNENCDELEPFVPPKPGQYVMYTSNKDGQRFNVSYGNFSQEILKTDTLVINPEKQYQKINGWGGAFTDSAGININSLKGKVRERLLKSYFDKTGIEYSLCRVPIGGTDFSTRPYTYLDEKDETLNSFNLTQEDHELKIPLIQEALKLTDNKLRLFGSAWSAPAWMKTNDALAGVGYLYERYYQQWADYYMKFLEFYEKEGIGFWGLTTGNEPVNGILPVTKINSLGWTPTSQSNWIRKNLGPTIRQSKYKELKIMALDDQRFFLPWWPMLLLRNNETRSYIDGIAVHWYWDEFLPASLLTRTHNLYPEKFILASEACVGDKFWQKSVEIGSWNRGEMYFKDIIQDVNHWTTGWIDWNMALDTTGGPTYIDNNVDSPIIVNATAQEFYKQPMFYAIGHFSKFVPVDSKRIDFQLEAKHLRVTAFLRPDNGITVIVQNENDEDTQLTIIDKTRGASEELLITKRSFNTIVYY